MAKPTTYVGSAIAIYLEDPDSPGTFLKPCGLNNHTASFTKEFQTVNVPDCDDPELPSWVERGVQSLDFSATGEGILAAESIDAWWNYYNRTESILARIYVGKLTDIENGRYWEGRVHVSTLSPTGNAGSKAEVSVAIVSDGELTFNQVA